MTKGLLYNYHQQIEQMRQNGNVAAYLLKGRINDFYKDNGIVIDGIINSIREIQDSHLVIIDNKVQETEPDADGKKHPVFKEGKTKEMMDAMWASLMSTPDVMKWKMPSEEEIALQNEAKVAPVTEEANG